MKKQLPSIMDDHVIEEYMTVLFDSRKYKEYNDISDLLKYIENIEKQFDLVVKELHDIKEQINTMQSPTMKMRVLSAVDRTQNIIDNSINNLNDIKIDIISSMKSGLDTFKSKGKNGINKTINLLHINEALKGMRKSFFIAMNKTEQLSFTIDAMTSEMRNAKRNVKNIGLLFLGKEINLQTNDKSKINIIQKSVRSMSGILRSMIIKTSKMIDKLENLEKKSVKKELKILSESSDNKKMDKSANKEQFR